MKGSIVRTGFLKQKKEFFILILLIISVVVVYLPVFDNSLTNWDDEMYIIYNPYLRNFTLDNFFKIFSNYFAGNYHPLTMFSLSVDYKTGGENPWPYHLSNLLFHVANTLLVYIFVKKLIKLKLINSGRYQVISFTAAILFGIHTLNVESVAWISERKNLLYTFFFLLSLIAYLRFIKTLSLSTYILSVALFIFSLLSKGTAVTLSLCIILIDFLSGRDILSKKVIFEKIPFLALSVIFGLIAIQAQRSGDAVNVKEYSLINQFSIAGYGFVNYIVKLIIPFRLSAYYPYPAEIPKLFYFSFALSAIFLFCIFYFFRKTKIVIFSVLFYIVNIGFVIQILPVGDAIMADRYVYVPSIGFFILAGYFISWIINRFISGKWFILSVFVFYCVFLSFKTINRIKVWENSLTLWNDSIEKFPENNDRGYLNRGSYYFDNKKYDLALNDFNKLFEFDPENNGGYIGIGRVKQEMQDTSGAMDYFTRSIRLKPSFEAFIDRAALRCDMDDFKSALLDLDSAYTINPDRTEYYQNKGVIYYLTGKYKEALESYRGILKIDPDNAVAYMGMGLAKQALSDHSGALFDFNKSVNISPDYDAYINRAVLKNEMKDFEGAIEDLEEAIKIDPVSNKGLIIKGEILINKGKPEEALNLFREVLIKDKLNIRAKMGMAMAYKSFDKYDYALHVYDSILSETVYYDAFINRAVLKKEIKDFNGAVYDLESAISSDSSRTGAYLNMAKIYYDLGDYRLSEFYYDKVLQKDNSDCYAFIGKGLIRQVAGDFSAALNFFDLSLNTRITSDGYINRAVLKMKTEDIDGAWKDLENALKIDPAKPEIYINRGVIELNYGEAKNAAYEFTKAINLDNNNYITYLYRGIAKFNLNDFAGSKNDLDTSLFLSPSKEAYYYRGLSFYNTSNKAEGCADLKKSYNLGYKDALKELDEKCR